MSVINAEAYSTIQELMSKLLEVSHEHEMVIVIFEGKPLVFVPAEVAKEKIASRIAKRLAENPSILSELQNRLDKEKPEDWE